MSLKERRAIAEANASADQPVPASKASSPSTPRAISDAQGAADGAGASSSDSPRPMAARGSGSGGEPSVSVAAQISIPTMPVTSLRQGHREKLETPVDPLSFYACVARTVSHSEMIRTPAAMEAAEVEWGRLRSVGKYGCWDEAHPRDKGELMAEARKAGKKMHFGKLMEFCVLKRTMTFLPRPNSKCV